MSWTLNTSNGQRVARRAAGGVTYLHGDHLGSTAKTTGAASSAQLYDAYGAKRGSSEVDTPYRYTGQRWEENDALDIYYYKARWYDPALGRFLQPDTIVPSAANPQSLNRYSYASNNPVRYNDPTGHYGPDVHRDLTYGLTYHVAHDILTKQYALATDQSVKVALDLADQVAKGDMAPDNPLSSNSSANPLENNIHFFSYKEATNLMNETLEQNTDRPATPAEFGRALHAIQDSYRHRSLGYTAGFLTEGIRQYRFDCKTYGETFDLGEALLNSTQWGHLGTSIPGRLLPWLVTDPDVSYGESPWPDLDAAMRKETEEALKRYLEEYIAWYLQQSEAPQNDEP